MIVVLVAAFAARYPEKASAMRTDLQQSYRELLVLQAQSAPKVGDESLWR